LKNVISSCLFAVDVSQTNLYLIYLFAVLGFYNVMVSKKECTTHIVQLDKQQK